MFRLYFFFNYIEMPFITQLISIYIYIKTPYLSVSYIPSISLLHFFHQCLHNIMAPFIPLKARIQLRLFSFLTGRAIRSDDTVNRRLLTVFEPLSPADPRPKSGVCSADVVIDLSRDLFVRVFVPSEPSKEEKTEKLPLVVYFHGGGFAFASPHLVSYDDWGRRMCSGLRAVIASVNYRRSPEHRCPAPYDDGVDVLKFLDSGGLGSIDILSGLDVDLGSCFLAGDTAGGNIVHHVARRWAATVDSWEKVYSLESRN